jgi:SAM-dependent methyltransferase
VYTREQVDDWFAPLGESEIRGKSVLEMGCGNGSLMVHVLDWSPRSIEGIDLGESVNSARANLERTGKRNWTVRQDDLTAFQSDGYDVVYSIGVLHHLQEPKRGVDAVVRNTRSGGCFHCWVYAKEGNGVVIALVEPIRKLASRLPWWITKYALATPLVFPYFLYAKLLAALPRSGPLRALPLYEYSLWISRREYAFFRHVAFDQIVTPRTVYIDRPTIEEWLRSDARIDPATTYIVMRNGNSWKFGGHLR